MDTLKKVTPSRFSTLPTLCWTEKGILTSPHIISTLSCFSIWGGCFFPTYNSRCWQSSERTLSVAAEERPKLCLVTFLSNIFETNPSISTFRCCSVSCQSHIWLHIVVGWTSRVVLWLVSRRFSQRAWAQFSLTAKIHPAEVAFSKICSSYQLKRRSSLVHFNRAAPHRGAEGSRVVLGYHGADRMHWWITL